MLPKQLTFLSKYLDGKQFFLDTDKPTYADFLLFDYFDIQQRYAPEVVAKFANVVAFIARMAQVPAIEKFLREQPQFVTAIYPPFCNWSCDDKCKEKSMKQEQ